MPSSKQFCPVVSIFTVILVTVLVEVTAVSPLYYAQSPYLFTFHLLSFFSHNKHELFKMQISSYLLYQNLQIPSHHIQVKRKFLDQIEFKTCIQIRVCAYS